MEGGSGRHAELAGDLVDRWKGLWQRGMASQVVLVAVPPGWGRTTVLERLAEAASADDAPVTLIARIDGRQLPDEHGLHAAALQACLAGAVTRLLPEDPSLDRAAAAAQLGLGVGPLFVPGMAAGVGFLLAGLAVGAAADKTVLERTAGITQLGLGVTGLFVPGMAAGVGFLLSGLAVGKAGTAWDATPAGQDGALARTARAVAATSVRLPVVVIIDDADQLDEGLALTLIENLAARHDGHVLTVAAVDPDSGLKKALTDRAWQGRIEGRVRVAKANPDMGFEARAGLVREVCPQLPDAAVRRIARATATFADLFAVTAAPGLADIAGGQDEAQILAAVDDAVRAKLRRTDPSPEAVIIAWAGGLLHARQARLALAARGLPYVESGGPEVLPENLVRVADPASPLLAAQVNDLPAGDRQAMATALLDEAMAIVADPGCGLLEQTVAVRAAYRVRRDLAPADRHALPRAQRLLAAGLEALGEPDEALQIAADALTAWPDGGDHGDRDWLEAAVLRLSRFTPPPERPPLVAELIAEANAGGAALGLEARIWAAITLLTTPGQRQTALELTEEVAAALDQHAGNLGSAATQWRLQLARHTQTAELPAFTQRLLAPLLTSGDGSAETAALAVLAAGGGPGADTRLQNTLLEAELAALPPEADDDLLRLHHALAANYGALGEYRQALTHGQDELNLRTTIQSPDHPDTLATRANIARWTGQCGDAPGALRLSRELLPDQERVLGPGHRDTLTTRANIAHWTGQCGDAAGALRLSRELLLDRERVLGPDHRGTLATRHNIARWTGQCGDSAGALRLYQELLPDRERVLGRDHPDTLTTRHDIAYWTGQRGDAADALRLSRELLPDRERVLGPGHPDTLATRDNIALRTGQCGDAAGALRLYRELLTDRERVQGPGHPDTLTARSQIAYWTAKRGDVAGALQLYRELLTDRERVQGPGHPDTLTTRSNIEYCAKILTENGEQ
jgi:tetratricopeptide (TPR) repeat protein